MGRRARRAGIVTGLTAMMAVLAPAAHAAKLTHDRNSGVLTFTAEPGELNRVTVSYDAVRQEFAVSDTGAGEISFSVSGGSRSGCRETAAGAACTSVRLTAVELTLGDLDDTLNVATEKPVRVNGGAGDDVIETGGGDDSLDGGPGADRLVCGGGLDAVAADAADFVDASCDGEGEAAAGNPPPPAEPGSDPADLDVPTDADGVPVPAPDIVLPVRPVTLGEPGIVRVELGCSADAAAVCGGDIYVTAPARHFVRADGGVGAARGRHVLRQRRLGHRRFRIEQGRTVTTSVPVLRGHFVMRNRRQRIRGRVLIVQRDAAGKVLGTTSRPVVLERKWSRRGKTRRRR